MWQPQMTQILLLAGCFIHSAICNTITETSSSWNKDIVCDEYEECWINCEGSDSCKYASIQCPQNNACHLSCTGTSSCDAVKLVAYAASSLSINCVQPAGSGNYDTSCYNMNINATASMQYQYSSSVDIKCVSESSYNNKDPCGYSTLTITNFNSLNVECDTENSCQGLTLKSYMNNIVDVNCNDRLSCNFAKMYINDSETVSIKTNNSATALRSSKIYIDGVSEELATIFCTGKDACEYTEFVYKNIQTDGSGIQCFYNEEWSSYYRSCHNTKIQLDASFVFTLLCDGSYACSAVTINGDCENTNVYCTSDGCRDGAGMVIVDSCENSDDITYIYPPSLSPTVGPTVPGPPTAYNVEKYSSSHYNIIGFVLSLIVLSTILIIVSWISHNKSKTNGNITIDDHEQQMIPQHMKLSEINATDTKEEQKFNTYEAGDAVLLSTVADKKPKLGFEKLGKEELLVPGESQSDYDLSTISWTQDIIMRKNCYFELVPHLIDHCFGIAVILKFCDIKQNGMLLGACLIVFSYRIISSIQLAYYTKNVRQTLLQLFDMECFEALIVNYKSDQPDKSEPCAPQKWISLMEATFQTVPMSVFLMTYLISNGYVFSKYMIIIQFAAVWCFVVIVIRNMNEDEVCFKNATTQRLKARLREDNITEPMQAPSKYPWMLILRLMDTLCRIVSVSLLAAVSIYAFIVIAIVEFVILLIYGFYKKSISNVIYHMFIRCDITDTRLTMERWCCNFVVLGVAFICMNYLIDVEVSALVFYFPYIVGVINFFFIAIIHRRFSPFISWYIEKNEIYFNQSDVFNQSRSIDDLVKKRLWKHIFDFIEFGFDIQPSVLLTKHPKLLEYVSEDLEENGAKPFLYFLMSSTNMSPKHYNDMFIGALQAYENKESLNENDYKEPIDLLKQLIGNPNVNINYQTSHNKRTALHILCLKRHTYLLDLILNEASEGIQDRVINPNLFDKNNESPLHILCNENDNTGNILEMQITIIQKLFSLSNINVNIQSMSHFNETPLHYSIKHNNYSLVKLFITNNTIDLSDNIRCGSNENYLHYCARNNGQDENIVFMIFNNDKYEYDVNTVDMNGNVVLHKSFEKANFVEKLLECKEIDVNVSNNKGIVPIVKTIQYKNNNYALTKLIKHHSLDINAIDNSGNPVLYFCIKTIKKNTEHLQLVLNHPNIDVNIRNNTNVGGYSTLHLCYLDNTVPLSHIQSLLISKSIDVNIKSLASGDTPLHIAVRLDLWNMYKMDKLQALLYHSNMKSKNMRNNMGKTPMNIANEQYNAAQQRLQSARMELMQREKELSSAQIKYQQKSNVYQQKLIAYNMKKQTYDMQYASYQNRLSRYNSLPPEIKNRSSRPSPPSTTIYSSEESAMRSAQYAMESAERDVTACESRVNSARELVSYCEMQVDTAQTIINTLR